MAATHAYMNAPGAKTFYRTFQMCSKLQHPVGVLPHLLNKGIVPLQQEPLCYVVPFSLRESSCVRNFFMVIVEKTRLECFNGY